MTYNPRPTRAEVSDVANAVLDGADCVMLSGETAKGTYPIEAVTMMNNLCCEAERTIFYPPLFNELRAVTAKPTSVAEAIASSAVNASLEQEAAAIIVLTTTGNSARLLAKYRPRIPIITVTRYAQIGRQVHLHRGCYSFHYVKPSTAHNSPNDQNLESPHLAGMEAWQEDVDARLEWGMSQGKAAGLLKPGDQVIAVQGWRGGSGHTSVMRLFTVPK